MTPKAMAERAASIAQALAEEFCSGHGVGILPERYAFSLSIHTYDEPRFLRILEALLRANQASGQEPPVNVLAFRWVSPSFEGEGLDQTEWQIIFQPNALQPEATDAETISHLHFLMDVISDHGIVVTKEGPSLWEQVALLGTCLASPDALIRAIANALCLDPRIAPFVHPGYPCDVQAQFPPSEAALPGHKGSLIWVRVVGVGPQADTWVGHVLNNDPFVSVHEGDLVLLACDDQGVRFAGRVRRNE